MRANAGKLERLAYERHERDLRLSQQPGGHPRGFVYSPEAGDRVVTFIESFCKHHKGEWAGKPLILEEWQRWIFRTLFGWLRADGSRRFRRAWVEVPRKNGKTELGGATGVYLLAADNEAGAEVYTTATKREQAAICHTAAREMVRASPELSRFVHVPKKPHGNLVCERLGSKMEILASDYGTLDGLSPHGDIRDEVHAWTDHGLSGVLDTAMGARRQPLTLEITTAGTYDPEGVGWQHHDYAVNVLEGTFEDDRLFVFIAAADLDDDPWDEKTWAKANPNLGITPKLDYIREQAEEAKRVPSKTNDFLRLHLNRWTQQITRWLPLEEWNACFVEKFDERVLDGEKCVGGLDLSSKLDLAALVLAFNREEGLYLLPRFWLPEVAIESALKKGRRHYEQWAKDGWIRTTPGDVIDYDFIRKEINELGQRFRLTEIAFDPWNATAISTDLMADGFQMIQTRQGYKTLSEPSKDLEARVVGRKVKYWNPVLRWCGLNAVIRSDANGNIAPDKEKAADKIDGVVAAIMALSRVVQSEGEGAYSESRGFVILDAPRSQADGAPQGEDPEAHYQDPWGDLDV